ncbi:MAG: fibronectin-binding domain-containing protein [Armatimonadetes bacterium]|nr:fibronectin-binding domain-containing protein [Armatimonadota bacterium]
MTCDSLMLRRIVTELRELSGLRVERVLPQGRARFVLEMRTRQPLGQVLVSGDPDAPRLHLACDREPVPGTDSPLTDVLRRHLRGATFTGAEQLGFDRVVRLHFANCEGLGPQSRRDLIVEISGRHTNVLLVDGEGVILECARHVTARVNRVRQSLPGEPYVPPPDFGKVDPSGLTVRDLMALSSESGLPWPTWWRQHLQGASDVFLAVLAERACLPLEVTLEDLDQTAWERLGLALTELLTAASGPGHGYVASPPGGRPVAYPVPLPGGWQALGVLPSLSSAIEVVHERVATTRALERQRQCLRSCLEIAVERARRREAARREALRKAEGAERERHLGELLLAHLHGLRPGQEEVVLTDWETGEAVTLRLDPGLSPAENAQRYFARYRKLQRVRETVPALLAEVQAELQDYEDLLDQVAEADGEGLGVIEAELLQRGLLKASRQARPPAKAGYRRTTTADGYAILYGRNALENAAVLREARPDDLWFHVQGAPGGHVVVRTDNRPEAVPQSTLIEAARLAARQSLRRREATVAVDYTLVKHLTRTRGAAPGHVLYRDFRTLFVRPRE